MFHLARGRFWLGDTTVINSNCVAGGSHIEPQIRGGDLIFDEKCKEKASPDKFSLHCVNFGERFCSSRCVEYLLKVDYELGLSPCYISSEQVVKTGRINKIVFLVLTTLALGYTAITLRYFAHRFFTNAKPLGKIAFYLTISFYAAIAIQMLRYAEITLKRQAVLKSLTGLLQQFDTHVPKSERACNLIKAVRLLSILLSILLSVSGLEGLWGLGNQWSFQTVLNTHAFRLYTGVHYTPPSNDSNGRTTPAEKYLCTISGWNFYQTIGLLLDATHQVISSSPQDFLFVSVLGLWIHTNQLRIQLCQAEINEENEERNNEQLKSSFEDLLQQYNKVRAISKELNKILSKLLPSIMLTCILGTSYCFHLFLERHWCRLLYHGIKLSKALGTIQLALGITEHIAAYREWFKAEETQTILQLKPFKLSLKLDELNHRPVGIGSGIYYIYDGFIASFLTIVSSYFFIFSESVKGRQECQCNCGI